MSAQTTGITALAEELLPAVPRPPSRPRQPRRRAHPATALLAVGLVAVTVVMGAAVLTLRADVVALQQREVPAVSCSSLHHIHLHVAHRTVRCTIRKAKP